MTPVLAVAAAAMDAFAISVRLSSQGVAAFQNPLSTGKWGQTPFKMVE